MPTPNAEATSVTLNIPAPNVGVDTRVERKLALVALAACLLGTWMLLHPFEGIFHDSVLYSFQALARLNPDPLAHDIYLRFGSQDQYTIFSPVYAATIRLLGLEPAAAILTFLFHALFFLNAWLLARRFMRTELALLAVGLLLVLPSGYGAYHIFHYTEEFLTPRQGAEAMVLAGLAALLGQRKAVAFVCIGVAMALHPIMGAAGAVMLVSRDLIIPKPTITLSAAVLGFLVLASIACIAPLGPVQRMDDTWLHIVSQSAAFLFILHWPAADWARTLLPLGILAVGAVIAADRSTRVFCGAGLITAVAGIALTLIGGDLLHIVIVIQAQTWRWLWVSDVVAVLLMPAIFRDCWKSNALARSAALLLVAAWISRGQSVTLCSLLVGVAVVAALAARRELDFRHESWMLRGAAGTLAVFLLASLASKLQVISLSPAAFDDPLPIPLQLTQLWSQDGMIPAALIVAVWLAGRRWNVALTHGAVLLGASIGCALLWPSTWRAWSGQAYSAKVYGEYAPLRTRIPLHAEVLWPDSPTTAVWYLLERQSYVSGAQMAGLVFSRPAALAVYQRAQRVGPMLGRVQFEDWVHEEDEKMRPEEKLRIACRAPGLGYVVSASGLGLSPLASYTPDPRHPNVQVRLYRCADLGTVSP